MTVRVRVGTEKGHYRCRNDGAESARVTERGAGIQMAFSRFPASVFSYVIPAKAGIQKKKAPGFPPSRE